MEKSQHRHDISDKAWAILEPMLPGQRGQWGGIAEDNRRFINGVIWILRTGAPWRDLPPDYGKWGSVHQRFRRWRDKGIWEKILEALIDDPDYEMAYDRCKPLQGSSSRRWSKGRQSGYEPYKRGLNTKIHLAVDSSGMPVRAIITEGHPS